MFRGKRGDKRVDTIEARYGINLNARGDTLLRNLLVERGFDSLTQLLRAYRGQLRNHPRQRRLFLSFHAEDRAQVQGFRLMARNKFVNISFYDGSVRVPINSDHAPYVRRVIREKIRRSSVLVCLIGNGTAWREWVDWEISTAVSMHKGVCGVRLKGTRGRAPSALTKIGAPIARWSVDEIVRVIECAGTPNLTVRAMCRLIRGELPRP